MLLMGTFMFYSCSSKDDGPAIEDNTSLVSFEFDANTLVSNTKAISGSETPDPTTTLCVDGSIPLTVLIKLKGPSGDLVLPELSVKSFNGILKTDPYELPSGDYTVMSVTVFNTSNPSQVIYSGVLDGAPFAKFVPDGYLMEKQSFKLLKYTKPTVKLYVLCARNYTATDFGMPKFELNRIEVTCFDIFFNVCDDKQEHFVGAGTIGVYNEQGTTLLYSDVFNGGTLVNGEQTAGNIATVCFADNMEIRDNTTEKFKIKVVFNAPFAAYNFEQVISVDNLLKFKTWKNFDTSMNAVHVVLCGPNDPKVLFPGYHEPAAK